MKVLVLPDAERAASKVAELIAETVANVASPVLGLATGGTMEPVYSNLVRRYDRGELSFAATTTFNLDEYIGLPKAHPQSYHSTMRRLLFDHVDLDLGNCHLPLGDTNDPEGEAARYEAAIAEAGDIDLQLLGIGRNGHIGFNEPTSSLGARTRIKTLTYETRAANARFFDDPDAVPRYAITMGPATIMDARQCVVLATGASKAEAVTRMVEGPVGADCPATALQWHPKATIVLDRDAAGQLAMIDYYLYVHPDGKEPVLGGKRHEDE